MIFRTSASGVGFGVETEPWSVPMSSIIELVRRILSIVLLVSGGYLVFWPGEPLLVVGLQDFRQDFENRLGVSAEDKKDPEAFKSFMAHRTEDRTRDIRGERWIELAQNLRLADGQLGSRALRGGTSPRFVFRQHEAPFDDAGPWRSFQYLRVNDGEVWLSVDRAHPQEIIGLPPGFAFPHRTTGIALIVLALAVYIVLPRRKPAEDELRYGTFASVIGADLIGLVCVLVFGLLPFLIAWFNNPEGNVLSWWPITVSLWVMAALGIVLLGIAWHYSALSLRITDEGLVRRSLSGIETLAWHEMQRAEPYQERRGRVLGMLLMLSGRPGMVGQGILVASNEAVGVAVHMKSGRRVKIMANHLAGFDDVLAALTSRGVPGAVEASDFFSGDSSEDER